MQKILNYLKLEYKYLKYSPYLSANKINMLSNSS